ncbi:MAG TPA: MBL fold metallo-hydrolase [Steroidobacteraceae bacterium]|nr:MBL fold metallo-hydrolase [Steroidobacteraceae bacterium]
MRSHLLLIAALLLHATVANAEEVARVINLYDAFGSSSSLKKDWGFAALVEYGGRRVLFDTGNNAEIFEHNVKALGVDLRNLDAVVISHRHGDHTSGLTYLLEVNPDVLIYTPVEGAFFKGPLPRSFLTPAPGLPKDLRYFEGKPPERLVSGSPWKDANFSPIAATKEIFPGFHVIVTQSDKPGTLEMNELSLAVSTPQGLAVIVGCSHPGIDKILSAAARIDPRLYTAIGGFHLVATPDPEIRRVVSVLHDTLRLQRVAPAHCTSELGFSLFMEKYKERYDRAGLGSTISLPRRE